MGIIESDIYIFELINGSWSGQILDFILPCLRNKYFWIPLYVLIFSFIAINFKKQTVIFTLFIALSIASTDIISSHIIKKNVMRLRPCQQTENVDVRLLVDCGSGYSFTSSHAANHFGIASFLFFSFGATFGRFKYLLFPWAFTIAYAQVYVGVHFPLDILFGALVGFFIGYLWAKFYSKTIKRLDLA